MAIFASVGMFILKLLLLIFILGIIILVHEFGHFIWAKKFKVHIYEFSIGMGPVLKSWVGKKDKITYNLRWIPIGGFVSLAGEVFDDDENIDKKKLLCNKPWYQRLIIMVAGVVNNFILAILLFALSASIWGGGAIKPHIKDVTPDSAADKAGIKPGDTILAINDYKVGSWDKAQIILHYKTDNDTYKFLLEHKDGIKEAIRIKPDIVKDEKTGEETKVFGVYIDSEDTSGPFKVIAYSFKKFASLVSSMAYTIWGLVSGKVSLSALSGPVGIYTVVGESFSFSLGDALSYVIFILAFLSVNVGFINILPFPAFDGGHVLFLLIEAIRRKKVNEKIEGICNTIGFALIILLMIIITINDIIKLF